VAATTRKNGVAEVRASWAVQAAAPVVFIQTAEHEGHYTKQVFFAKEIKVNSDEYNVYGGAGVDGPNATVGAVNIMNYQQAWSSLQSQLDTEKLSPELGELLNTMRVRANTSEHFKALAEVAAAKDAADRKDGPTALSHLRQAGTWALGIAGEIGKAVVAKVIETAIGLP
jgi:hypothetical protein